MTDDILREIQDLKKDVGSSMDRLARLRYAELREAFTSEMRLAMAEEGRRWADMGFEGMEGSECPHRENCVARLSDSVSAAIDEFSQGNVASAAARLDSVLDLICGSSSPCKSQECSRMAAETVRRTKMVLSIWSRIGAPGADAPEAEEAAPDLLETALGPLANAKRIMLLRSLRQGERGLSDLGRMMDMRTGHLMFHISALKQAGYISADARTKLYSLTPGGRAALDGMDDLMARIGRARHHA